MSNQEINPMNPENIQEGDKVWLKSTSNGPFVVVSVGGRFNNKVYCKEVGHELYANCFTKVKPS